MEQQLGLRERKKAQTRQLLAETAARLFATQGFDNVSMVDVARAADVSDQTVYNYFPAKHDLVLDMADEFEERYSRTVRERPAESSPAAALLPLAIVEIERYRRTDLAAARGEYPALSVSSPVVRRFALEANDRQAASVTAALLQSNPGLHPALARAHAAALISVFQMIVDEIGNSVLTEAVPDETADELTAAVQVVFDDLDRHFRTLVGS